MRSTTRTRLFDLPEFAGKTNREIAQLLGVHHWTVGRIRNGLMSPGERFIYAAQQATGRSREELFYDAATEGEDGKRQQA